MSFSLLSYAIFNPLSADCTFPQETVRKISTLSLALNTKINIIQDYIITTQSSIYSCFFFIIGASWTNGETFICIFICFHLRTKHLHFCLIDKNKKKTNKQTNKLTTQTTRTGATKVQTRLLVKETQQLQK